MRTYDDTFSGQKIYPGKVCLCPIPSPPLSFGLRRLDTSVHIYMREKIEREQQLTYIFNLGQTLHPRR